MKSDEKFYDLTFGHYSGVLLREKLAKKLEEVLNRHKQEIKEVLTNNLEDLEVSYWTLAYPDGNQTSVTFYKPNSTNEEKIERIQVVVDEAFKPEFCKDGVFVADNMDDAEKKYMEWYKSNCQME